MCLLYFFITAALPRLSVPVSQPRARTKADLQTCPLCHGASPFLNAVRFLNLWSSRILISLSRLLKLQEHRTAIRFYCEVLRGLCGIVTVVCAGFDCMMTVVWWWAESVF